MQSVTLQTGKASYILSSSSSLVCASLQPSSCALICVWPLLAINNIINTHRVPTGCLGYFLLENLALISFPLSIGGLSTYKT